MFDSHQRRLNRLRSKNVRCKAAKTRCLLNLESLEPRHLLAVAAISISDASVVEGDAGVVTMDFTVTRTGDSRPDIVVNFTTADDTALAGSDYTSQTGTVELPSDIDSAVISVQVLGDQLDEADERFFVRLTGIASVTGPATPTFLRTGFASGASPQSVAVGDFNSDGRLDVAVANFLSGTVSVLLNNTEDGAGTPVLADRQDFDTLSGPLSLVAGDFNGDGLVDLAIASSEDEGITVLVNTTLAGGGTASFTRQDFLQESPPIALAVGDFNSDDRNDLAVIFDGDGRSVEVLLNDTPAAGPVVSFAGRQFVDSSADPVFVAAGDVNGDGLADLAVASPDDDAVLVYTNFTESGSFDSSFSEGTRFGTAAGPVVIAIGDINGDGRPDLAVAAADGDAISVLLNQTSIPGGGGIDFLEHQDFGAGDGPTSVALIDLDGDGLLDLAAANLNDDTVSVLFNQTPSASSTAFFTAQETFDGGAGPIALTTGDFNRDGRMDLAVANRDGDQASILLNTPAIIEDGEGIGTILDDDENSPPFVAAPIADQFFNQDAPDALLDLAGVFDDIDIDINEDELVLSLVANDNPAVLAALLSGTDLTLDFLPASFGVANITVRATDRAGAFVDDQFSVRVNALPVARPDVYRLSTAASSAASAADGVLANDSDVDGEGLSAVLVDPPAHGTVVLNADGSFTYTKGASFRGIDSFTYVATDESGQSNVARVSLQSHEACLVERLYRQVLGRSPGEAGLLFWISRLEAGEGVGRIAEGIFESDERINPIIRQWYRDFLSREADDAGLAFWRGVWQREGGSENVLVGLVASDEFFQKSGGTNAGWTTQLYQRLLRREPEPAGFKFWIDALDFRAITRAEVVNGFVRCNEDSERH
ncbi:MAG: FG-GAP-like repeat-containing protein, partial [Pirellulales bacterium]